MARTLPIYGDMEVWLRRQQETATGNSYVFHGKLGFPVDNHMLGWAEACERAGLPGLLFHDMAAQRGTQYETRWNTRRCGDED